MKKNILFFLLFSFLFLGINSLVYPQKKTSKTKTSKEISAPGPKDDPLGMAESSTWVKETMIGLTLEEKVAQLVIPSSLTYYTSEDNDQYKELVRQIKENKIGGFIFTLGDVYEAAMLANKLQAYSKIPLLISADFERGVAMRINRSTAFPYNMALGAAGDENLAFEMGKIVAMETRAIGVHQNYAPVVDLNNNPKNPIINVRSYGEDPVLVSKLANAFIRGTHYGKVISTVKHFPGHGDTDVDSHSDLPVLGFDRDRLNKLELVPFKNTIDSGVMSVMVAHLSIPALDTTRNLPATLSPKVITDLLKNELKFKGLTVTDAMEMRGVAKNFSIAESSIRAILAGDDMVLMPENADIAIKAIVDAVKNGKISKERIDESVSKVLAVKYWLGLNKEKMVDLNKIASIVAIADHLYVSKKIAQKSITILKNENNLMPIQKDLQKKIACISVIDNSESDYGSSFENGFLSRYKYATISKIDTRTTRGEFEKILNKAKNAEVILLPVYMKVRAYQGTISFNPTQKEYLDSIFALNKPVMMVSFGNPYLIMEFPKTNCYVNAYCDVSPTISAALEALFGEIDVNGKSPVEIPGFFKVGTGINLKKNSLLNGSPLDLKLKKSTFEKVDKIINKSILDSAFPGATLLIAKDGIVIHDKAYGKLDYSIYSRPVTTRTIFDLASVSKVISATNGIMKLIDEKKISLDDPVVKYIPEFGKNGKDKITIRNLLLHNSGFIPFIPFYKSLKTAEQVIDSIYSQKLVYKTGDSTVYSDFNFITLGKIIEKVSGSGLDAYMKKEFFAPLGMIRTMYNPPDALKKDCAPTEVDNYWRMRLVQGTVHDENAALLNGIAGHAGLFSTVDDLAIIMQMLMNGGTYGGKQYLSEDIIKLFTSRQSEHGSRGLGWGVKDKSGYSSAGKLFSTKSYGHTGFTGTCIWADPTRNLFVIFLTNRVNPSRENRKISRVREELHDTIIECLEDINNKID